MIKLLQKYGLAQQSQREEKLTLWMNHLLVLYAVLIPISVHGRAQILSAILILFLLRGNYLHFIKDLIKNPIIISLVIMFFMYVLWLFGTENFKYANTMIDQNKYAFLPILFLSFLDKRFILRVVAGFIFGIFFSEIVSYLISFHILPWEFFLFDKEVYRCNISGDPSPFMHRTRYGLALALAFSILLLHALTHHLHLKQKLFLWLFLLSITLNLSLTGGRIGYLLYFILTFSVIFMVYKKNSLKPLFLAFSSLLLVSFFAYNNSIFLKERVDITLNTVTTMLNNPTDFTSSFGQRAGMWYYGSDVIEKNFFFGVGTGDHVDAIKKEIQEQNAVFRGVIHPHNQFISVFIQFGFIGFLLFLNIFHRVFRYNYPSEYQRNIAMLVTISIIMTFMIEGDLVKFFLPLLTTLLSVAMANKEYKNIEITKIKSKTLLSYLLILSIALFLAFLI